MNLPEDTQETELRVFFNKCGALKRIKILRDNALKSVCKGYAYVTFKDD